MILFLHHFLHITVEMFFQQRPIRIRGQQFRKETVHIVEHRLKTLVQDLCILKGAFQEAQILSGIMDIRKNGGIDIADIDFCHIVLLLIQVLKSLQKNCRIIRDHNMGDPLHIILQTVQPPGAYQPVQSTRRRRLDPLQIRLIFLFLQFQPLRREALFNDLLGGLLADEIIVVLIFFIDTAERFHINETVFRTKQPPELLRHRFDHRHGSTSRSTLAPFPYHIPSSSVSEIPAFRSASQRSTN